MEFTIGERGIMEFTIGERGAGKKEFLRQRKGKEMTITEELRTMLDNRGIKWDEILDHENNMIGTRWKDSRGYFVTAFAYADCPHIKTFTDFFWQPTPKEAVEATLGLGMCRRVLYKPTGIFVCSKCGAGMPKQLDKYCYLHYCPNCGAKVLVDDDCKG